jgi:hypothetical protein
MPPKKRNAVDDLLMVAQAAETAMEEQDRQSEIHSAQARVATLPLSKVIDRTHLKHRQKSH